MVETTWTKTNETLPMLYETVLFFLARPGKVKIGIVTPTPVWRDKSWGPHCFESHVLGDGHTYSFEEATHWMPLPKPPSV
jgi:hypothetical protein